MQHMTYPPVYQYTAGLAWRASSGNLVDATAEFRKRLQAAHYDLPSNPGEYVQIWGPRLGDDGVVEGCAHSSGRHKVLTERQVTACYVEARNWWLAGRQGPYTSAEQLIAESAVVHNIVTDAGITPETLTNNLKEFDPRFKYGVVRDRAYLDDQHRQSRIDVSAENKARLQADKAAVVWVDEKVICLSKESYMGWFSAGEEDWHWRTPVPRYNKSAAKLKYIIGVNYLLGPVWIKFFTGTSGMAADRDGCDYRVSSGLEQLGALLGSNMLQRHLHSCCPAPGAAPHIICSTWVQPQHTETVGQRCICQCLVLGLPVC
jgi:hypothetical protein